MVQRTWRPRVCFESLEERSLLAALSIQDVRIVEQDGGVTIAAFTVSLSEPTTQQVTVEYQTVENSATSLGTRRVASGLASPLFATSPRNDPNRLFIVERGGAIKILDLATESVLPSPLLTVPNLGSRPEQGLLGLAFHPDFANNGVFYTSQVRPLGSAGVSQVSRWQMAGNPLTSNTALATSEDVIFSLGQPFIDHNGGWIGFGPDGYLYVAIGDGGSGYDQLNNSQHLDRLLGKLLRIDVNTDDFPSDPNRDYGIPSGNPFANDGDAATQPEIWAYGLRNPWRNSFDRATGNLYLADVGQLDREEINVQLTTSQGGENYGWRVREGTIPTPTIKDPPLSPANRIDPIFDYAHANLPEHGQAVTGGYVYNGPLDALRGLYFFGDFITGDLWSLRFDGSDPTTHNGSNFTELRSRNADLTPDVGAIRFVSSFAEDSGGNVYIVDLVDGDVFMIDPLADYQPERGALTFAPNETTKKVTVQVFGDTRAEADETFFVNLTNPINATISDGQAVGTITRTVPVQNQPPLLAAIGNKTVNSTVPTAISLTASDPNGEALAFTVSVEQQPSPVADLKLEVYDSRYDNWGGLQEKWLRNAAFKWFFLLPDGELRAWNGDNPPTGNLIAKLSTAVYSDPGALVNVGPTLSLPTVNVRPTGPTSADLLINPNGYQGNSKVTVTVTDPRGLQDRETFTIDFDPSPSKAPVVVKSIVDVKVNETTPTTSIGLFPVFDDADHAVTELRYSVSVNTNPGLVGTAINQGSGTLVLTYAGSLTGVAELTVRATDADRLFAEDTFTVTRTAFNNPPVLAPLGDVRLNPIGTTVVPLLATDAERQPISFKVQVESEAYLLAQRLALESYEPNFNNWGGRQEKWVLADDFQWYFLLPNGELHDWDRSGSASGNLIANVGSYFYANPDELVHAQAGAVGLATFTLQSVNTTSANLLINATRGVGTRFNVIVTAFDAQGDSDSESFAAFF